MTNNTMLCQINNEGFTTKPTDLKFMGKLRDKMIQRPWSSISEDEFVYRVTWNGHAFYGCLFNGHDLMETGKQRDCWRAQTIIGVDIDKTDISPEDMAAFYCDQGFCPWLVYSTFSDLKDGKRSYRLLWRVEVDHNITYDQWRSVIKELGAVSGLGDKHAQDCTRMWQGSLNGPSWWVDQAPVAYSTFAKKLGL